MNYLFIYFLLFVGGVAIALQARVMGNLSDKASSLSGLVVTYAVGFAVSIFLLIGFVLMKKERHFEGGFTKSALTNWWADLANFTVLDFTAGIFGLVVLGTVGVSTARVGTLTTLVVVFFFQILAAAILDHFGLMGSKVIPITATKFWALVIIGAGLLLFIKE